MQHRLSSLDLGLQFIPSSPFVEPRPSLLFSALSSSAQDAVMSTQSLEKTSGWNLRYRNILSHAPTSPQSAVATFTAAVQILSRPISSSSRTASSSQLSYSSSESDNESSEGEWTYPDSDTSLEEDEEDQYDECVTPKASLGGLPSSVPGSPRMRPLSPPASPSPFRTFVSRRT